MTVLNYIRVLKCVFGGMNMRSLLSKIRVCAFNLKSFGLLNFLLLLFHLFTRTFGVMSRHV